MSKPCMFGVEQCHDTDTVEIVSSGTIVSVCVGHLLDDDVLVEEK